MRIHIIACRVFSRELNYLASQSDNQVDITWIGRGLHNEPKQLCGRICGAVEELYAQLEARELENRPDYIVLGYGLCSNSVVGVRCRDIPIVIPRTDDCIALFLGSQKRYLREFTESAGTYWFNSGWIEQSTDPLDGETARRRRWMEYAERYGEDNADYLMEMESGWTENYSTLGYIRSRVYDPQTNRDWVRREAEKRGWKLHEVDDDLRMLQMMVDGTWNDREFLILQPGERVEPDYTGLKLRAVRDE